MGAAEAAEADTRVDGEELEEEKDDAEEVVEVEAEDDEEEEDEEEEEEEDDDDDDDDDVASSAAEIVEALRGSPPPAAARGAPTKTMPRGCDGRDMASRVRLRGLGVEWPVSWWGSCSLLLPGLFRGWIRKQ